jgi:hypothetical protein
VAVGSHRAEADEDLERAVAADLDRDVAALDLPEAVRLL